MTEERKAKRLIPWQPDKFVSDKYGTHYVSVPSSPREFFVVRSAATVIRNAMSVRNTSNK